MVWLEVERSNKHGRIHLSRFLTHQNSVLYLCSFAEQDIRIQTNVKRKTDRCIQRMFGACLADYDKCIQLLILSVWLKL